MSQRQVLTETAAGGAPQPVPTCPALVRQAAMDWDSLAPLQAEWDDFVARAGGDICFTFDWCRTWWRHYGRRYRLCVLLFRRDDRLVGLLPMMIDRLWCGPFRVRLAKLLGSECTTIVLNPPVLRDHAEAVYASALRYLLEQQRCDGARFSPMTGFGWHHEVIRRLCAEDPARFRLVRDRDLMQHFAIHLPETYEDYLAGLGGETRSSLRRKRRRFESQCKPVFEVIDDPDRADQAFDDFLELHQTRWHADHQMGHFGNFPRSVAFNRDLVRAMAARGRLLITRLRVDGRPVACEYNYAFADNLFWRLPGRKLGQPWESFSLGYLSLAYLFEAAIRRGLRHVDAGWGSASYKRHLGAVEAPTQSLIVAPNRRWSIFKAGPVLRFHWRMVNLFYSRIWHSRIKPHLPEKLRGPFWHVWLRSRI